jgi:phenylpropionate dioxygenase-like ring-hydroxylating dioxygenase large terminal subunit
MNPVTESEVRAACLPNPARASRPTLRQAPPELPVSDILAEIGRIADLPLPQATTLPPQAYTSEEFFRWEIANLFENDWIALCHVSQIPSTGDFLNLEVFGEPLIIVRSKLGDIRVLSRVCPHRAMDIMPPGFGYDGHSMATPHEGKPGCGNTRFFLCPYHFWTFELDGGLKACAEMGETEGFQRDEWGLRTFRSEVWNGFVFVNLDGSAPRTVAQQYTALAEDIAPWNPAGMELIAANEWDCSFNWKVLAENFMESYHHAGAHSKTLQPMMRARDTWTEEEKPFHIRCHLPMRETVRAEIQEKETTGDGWDNFPPIPGLPEEERFSWGLVMGYPLFTYVYTADSLIWYRILPVAPDRLQLLTTILVPKSSTGLPDFEKRRERANRAGIEFHLEDMEVCMAVQRGLTTAGYQRGRLSHLEMSVWLIQRYLAARSRGTWPTMDRPAAASQEP